MPYKPTKLGDCAIYSQPMSNPSGASPAVSDQSVFSSVLQGTFKVDVEGGPISSKRLKPGLDVGHVDRLGVGIHSMKEGGLQQDM